MKYFVTQSLADQEEKRLRKSLEILEKKLKKSRRETSEAEVEREYKRLRAAAT